MHADTRKLLWDAQQAADRIARFTSGKSFADYEVDEYLRSAVERQFEIVGEALGHLGQIDSATAATIPELRRIIAFRNVLIHGATNTATYAKHARASQGGSVPNVSALANAVLSYGHEASLRCRNP